MSLWDPKCVSLALVAVGIAVVSGAGGGPVRMGSRAPTLAASPAPDRQALALRFAPWLYLHPDEPFEILAVIPVLHPHRPLIAYHIFFAEDALLAGHGDPSDHEIVWVAYDPVTLEVTDVLTLWHRAVLRTDACVAEARANGGRPRLEVQWGQHGILPFGWRAAPTRRTRCLLRLHYLFMRYLGGMPWLESRGYHVSFSGSYADYLRFAEPVDLAPYVGREEPLVAEWSTAGLESRFHRGFQRKREWPDL